MPLNNSLGVSRITAVNFASRINAFIITRPSAFTRQHFRLVKSTRSISESSSRKAYFYKEGPAQASPISETSGGLLQRYRSISVYWRVLLQTTILISLGVFGLSEGAKELGDFFSALRKMPTDQETLTLFKPEDPESQRIDDGLRNNELAKSLRSNENLNEARMLFKIPEEFRRHNLTAGILSGPDRIWVPPLSFTDKQGRESYIFYYLGKALVGYPGIVHGGLLATILDEGMARTCFPALPNKVGMTASLSINYKAPCRAEQYVVLKAQTTKVEGRKAYVTATLESLPEDDSAPIVFVEATALFIEPKNAAGLMRLVAK